MDGADAVHVWYEVVDMEDGETHVVVRWRRHGIDMAAALSA